MIKNASDLPLSRNVGTLPNVSGAIMNRMRPMVFQVKSKIVDQSTFDTKETQSELRARAERIPYKPTEQEIEAVGSRSWRWETLRTVDAIDLSTDDVVVFEGRPYRVMAVTPYSEYGYQEYRLCEDYKP